MSSAQHADDAVVGGLTRPLEQPGGPPFGRAGRAMVVPLKARLGQLFRRLKAAAVWPKRVYRNRRTLGSLAPLTGRELADIGLLRQDLSDCAALPLSAELGLFLAARVSQRRRSRV